MATAKVVADLADACAGGAATYSAWTTAKALVQRRYVSARAQGTFEDCVDLLVALAEVTRTYLRVDLAQELIRELLLHAVEHFSAKADAARGDSEARVAFDGSVATALHRIFNTLAAATKRTYRLAGPLPLIVEWRTGTEGGVDDGAAAQSLSAVSWVEGVVLECALRATACLAQRSSSSVELARWAQNVYTSYEQLLALRLAGPSSLTSSRASGSPLRTTAAAAPPPPPPPPRPPSVPVATLISQLLRMSAFSWASRAEDLGEDKQSDASAPSPVIAAVHWLTHFASDPARVNHLFVQYVFHDILRRGAGRITATSPPPSSLSSMPPLHSSVNAALEEKSALSRREALVMARAAVAAYRQAFPAVLHQHAPSAPSRQTSTDAPEDAPDSPGDGSSTYLRHYSWTWFLDSLTLTLTHSGGVCEHGVADAPQRETQRRVCAQLLQTYTKLVAELPGLRWSEVVDAYTSA
ncbi:hypothetical protein NESM_000042700 [Novymonas esmeraldas]|uniref:Uncharacterized protein n=1 Tax=Novymonas esmeraldas TaxID=1808958 RepID=A0AAW0F0M9_9TRYP